jgi:8-oxo-dGTP diphosphatase
VIPCVGAIITDDQGRLLLIKRAHAPGAGLWSLPGGRVEPGENDAAALAREMREETGLDVSVNRLIGTVQLPGGFVVRDYQACVTGGVLVAGDDAAEARWVSADELAGLPLTSGLVETLHGWGALPA